MPFRVGPTELIIILVIVMIIFGVGRLADVGGAMGKAIREFRKGQLDEPEPLAEAGAAEETEEKEKSTT